MNYAAILMLLAMIGQQGIGQIVTRRGHWVCVSTCGCSGDQYDHSSIPVLGCPGGSVIWIPAKLAVKHPAKKAKIPAVDYECLLTHGVVLQNVKVYCGDHGEADPLLRPKLHDIMLRALLRSTDHWHGSDDIPLHQQPWRSLYPARAD